MITNSEDIKVKPGNKFFFSKNADSFFSDIYKVYQFIVVFLKKPFLRDASTIKATLSQLENAADAVSKFTINLKTASERLNQKNNVAGVLLNDSITAASLKITLKNLETSSQKLDEDLEALQHNFLLRGFFRKKEKAKKE